MLVKRFCLGFVLTLVLAQGASGQNLIEMYQKAHFEAQAREIFKQRGMRVLPEGLVSLPPRSDAVRHWLSLINPPAETLVVETPQEPALAVTEWRPVRRLERFWFEKRFPRIRWAYSGTTLHQGLDTTWTRELRARMEAAFGAPTQTVAESRARPGSRTEEYIQFEYWLIANDTIPLLVMDVNGPFDRGVVVATSQEYRNQLYDLRRELYARIMAEGRRETYIDYYFLSEERQWYRTGYDGRRYFTDRIAPPDLSFGRPRIIK